MYHVSWSNLNTQMLPEEIPFNRTYYTDPDDDVRFGYLIACALYTTGVHDGVAPQESDPTTQQLSGATIALTNKGIWAVTLSATDPENNKHVIQGRRIGWRDSPTQFHSVAVEYDGATSEVHFEIEGRRKLSIDRFGAPSDRLTTLIQIGDAKNDFARVNVSVIFI